MEERQSRNTTANQMGEELHCMKNERDIAASAWTREFSQVRVNIAETNQSG